MNAAYKNPVDTGRKLNVQKTFRRRPGRLLNVLYTFNVLPAPTGNLQAEIFQIPCNLFQMACSQITKSYIRTQEKGSRVCLVF